MIIMKKHLSRRTFLRGAFGATVALPLLDAMVPALTTFDLQSRLNTAGDVKLADLLKLYADNVTDWPPEDEKAVAEAFAFVAKQLRDFELAKPESILLIRTTGKEEAGAAYCRGPAIVLPEGRIRQEPDGLRKLVAHELFHVLSTHNPELRRDLYAIIGFQLCEPIELPASLKERAITNPDAPLLDAYIQVEPRPGEKLFVMPVLYASAAKFDPDSGKSLFDYMQFKLMAIEEAGGKWQATVNDGRPISIEPKGLESYFDQIGKNTGYIIHPDEILADNFAHLVLQTEKLPNPEIIEKMRQRLANGK
jgi:hypothetical protein